MRLHLNRELQNLIYESQKWSYTMQIVLKHFVSFVLYLIYDAHTVAIVWSAAKQERDNKKCNIAKEFIKLYLWLCGVYLLCE